MKRAPVVVLACFAFCLLTYVCLRCLEAPESDSTQTRPRPLPPENTQRSSAESLTWEQPSEISKEGIELIDDILSRVAISGGELALERFGIEKHDVQPLPGDRQPVALIRSFSDGDVGRVRHRKGALWTALPDGKEVSFLYDVEETIDSISEDGSRAQFSSTTRKGEWTGTDQVAPFKLAEQSSFTMGTGGAISSKETVVRGFGNNTEFS